MNGSSSSPQPPDAVELRETAARLARQAGDLSVKMQARAAATAATKSSSSDIVTAADQAAEELIVEGLTKHRPDDGIEGEEGTSQPGHSGIVWHIDPIDGTTNYLYGLPYCVSIAATFEPPESPKRQQQRELVAGAVYDPTADELFKAALGMGATLNDKKIEVNQIESLSVALVATGFSYLPEKRRTQALRLSDVITEVRDIRRIGAAAIDLCAVAAGRCDAYFEEGLNFWDMAAGILIAREAGAIVSDNNGEQPSSTSLVAAAPNIHADLLAVLQRSSAPSE